MLGHHGVFHKWKGAHLGKAQHGGQSVMIKRDTHSRQAALSLGNDTEEQESW